MCDNGRNGSFVQTPWGDKLIECPSSDLDVQIELVELRHYQYTKAMTPIFPFAGGYEDQPDSYHDYIALVGLVDEDKFEWGDS